MIGPSRVTAQRESSRSKQRPHVVSTRRERVRWKIEKGAHVSKARLEATTMDSDPPLPFAPRAKRISTPRTLVNAPSAPFSFAHRTTGFNFDGLSGPPSSDTPLFSSDDFQPGLEDYTPALTSAQEATGAPCNGRGDGGARKRRYRGTWWGEKVQCRKKRTRTGFKNKRDMDSGVWMMSSDDSAGLLSSDILDDDGEGGRGKGHAYTHEDNIMDSPVMLDTVQPSTALRGDKASRKFLRTDRAAETEPQRHARSAIDRCLEEGNDNVDLSYFNLQKIPPGTFQPLIQLTKEPALENAPISEEGYSPLEPFLRLYLAQNRLTLLPREMFDLQGLMVLSLRQNELNEIPCAIQKLTNLQDLNLAVNRLEHLPWELLSLMQKGDLKRLTVHPNPFIQLDELNIAEWFWDVEEGDAPVSERLKPNTYSGDANPKVWLPIHIANSPVSYFDMEGHPLSHSDTLPPPNRAQSLRELSLQACLRSPQVSHFLDLTILDAPEEEHPDFPAFVVRLLRLAKQVKLTGDRTCSVCARTYVVPRAEWVEWWDCTPYENGSKIPRVAGQRLWPLPFLRRGCSWACGRDIQDKQTSNQKDC
ncbi:Leucine Rich Repeat family protein [Coccidioides posadasii C735 delta SOWgp]|nr:Leucine Rich Repeat family protein [Coccidioides posadasii C735 delta SOWgp]EER23293.1 Leucine Rich Repeat family protein [Coccidioides posadasii C735 delta SOWgp]|eukprot:XP_003065438.1 Leucine Rich Repeat family protein [Coccidioides posadasii C735 delta SOWgp]